MDAGGQRQHEFKHITFLDLGEKNVDSLQISGVIVEWEENEFCHNQ